MGFIQLFFGIKSFLQTRLCFGENEPVSCELKLLQNQIHSFKRFILSVKNESSPSKWWAWQVLVKALLAACQKNKFGLRFIVGLNYRLVENFIILSIMNVRYAFLNCQKFTKVNQMHKNLLIHVIKVIIHVYQSSFGRTTAAYLLINENKLR